MNCDWQRQQVELSTKEPMKAQKTSSQKTDTEGTIATFFLSQILFVRFSFSSSFLFFVSKGRRSAQKRVTRGSSIRRTMSITHINELSRINSLRKSIYGTSERRKIFPFCSKITATDTGNKKGCLSGWGKFIARRISLSCVIKQHQLINQLNWVIDVRCRHCNFDCDVTRVKIFLSFLFTDFLTFSLVIRAKVSQ